jgi:DNA mismatch endonuclease (patch repair protein)
VTDVLSKQERSKTMSLIRGRENKATELALVKILRRHGLTGWRRHARLPGTPDFVFTRQRLAVFVDGCFWHGCPKHCRMPASNRKYWNNKILRNKRRDRLVSRALRQKGWRVARIWEHELKFESRVARKLRRSGRFH